MIYSLSSFIRKTFKHYWIMWTQTDHLDTPLLRKKLDKKLALLGVLIPRTKQGFRSSVYRKPAFTGKYLNFSFRHSFNVMKWIVHCLHRERAMSNDIDTYQEEINSLRNNLYCNYYRDSITSTPRNLYRTTENDTRNLISVCLPMSKAEPKYSKDMLSIWCQDNIQEWLGSLKISLSSQATNRIQYDQDLRILHPKQLL